MTTIDLMNNFFVKYKMLSLIIFVFLSCNSQNNNELTILESKVKIALVKFDNQDSDSTPIKLSKHHFNISGIYNKINPDNIKDGIYILNFGTHMPVNYFIYENNEVVLLNLSSFDTFLKSVRLLTNYSIKEGYCKELISDYLSRMTTIFFNTNNNLKKHHNNCEFEKTINKSNFSLNEFKAIYAEYLVRNREINNIEDYYKESDKIIVSKVGYYYGIKNPDTKIEVGIYYVINMLKNNLNTKVVILYKNEFKVLKINHINNLSVISNNTTENYIESVSEILKFSNNNNFCINKIRYILDEIFMNYFENESCLTNSIKHLP